MKHTLSPVLMTRLSSLAAEKLSWSSHKIKLNNLAKDILVSAKLIQIIPCKEIILYHQRPPLLARPNKTISINYRNRKRQTLSLDEYNINQLLKTNHSNSVYRNTLTKVNSTTTNATTIKSINNRDSYHQSPIIKSKKKKSYINKYKEIISCLHN